MKLKTLYYFLTVACMLGLFACSNTSEEVSPSDSGDSSNAGNSAFATEMLNAVNQLRAEGCNCGGAQMPPVPALTWNSQLEAAALRHATDMHENDFNSHTGSDGSNVGQRIKDAGYDWSNYGENIAWDYTSLSVVINAWKNSSGHCKNMMKSNVEDFGAARVGNKWVQVFGKK